MDHYHIQITRRKTSEGKRWFWRLLTYETGGTLLAVSKAYKSGAGAWSAGGRLYEAIKSGESVCTFSWDGESKESKKGRRARLNLEPDHP